MFSKHAIIKEKLYLFGTGTKVIPNQYPRFLSILDRDSI